MNNTDLNFLIERIYKLEEAYKGFTTRLRLIEAAIDKIEERERKRL
jgi:hypothetical protein